MSKVAPLYSDFSGGEVSPLLFVRAGTEVYNKSLETCLNWVPLSQGPAERRPSTHFLLSTKYSDKKSRLIEFIYSTEQAYVMEFGDLYIRFVADRTVLGSGAFADVFAEEFNHFSAVELTTPYVEADLFNLMTAQSDDELYIAHPSYAPRKVVRNSASSWTLNTLVFEDGPYDDVNTTDTTLTLSGTSGTVTVTASAVTGINDDEGFKSTDVGRLIRFKDPAGNWTWLTITVFTSTTVVTATVDGETASAGTATTDWRLGIWSETTGYPSTVSFHQNRLVWGGGGSNPQRIDFSKINSYNDYAPTDRDGTIVADRAFSVVLASNKVNAIQWLDDHEKGFLVGTTGGEWVIGEPSASTGLSATNVKAVRPSTYGSAKIAPVSSGEATLFVQSSGRKVREMAYVFESDGFRAPDMTSLAEHITETGIVEMAYQQEPHNIIWAVRTDGQLLGFTYDRGQQVTGWHRHKIGGSSDAAGTHAKVESIASVPNPNQDGDDLIMVVQRYVNGQVMRYVEYLEDFWRDYNLITDAKFADSGLDFNGTPQDLISGLDHLEGETVAILADGSVHPSQVVTNGSIQLNKEYTKVHVGLAYQSDIKTLRNDFGARDGTSQGKTQRIHEVTLRVHSSVGGQFGPDFDNLDPVVFRKTSDAMDTAVPAFTGDKEVEWDADYTSNTHMVFRIEQPLPATLVAMMPRLVTNDG